MSLTRIWLALVVLSLVLIILHSNSLSNDVALEENAIQNLESYNMDQSDESYDPLYPSSDKPVKVLTP